MEDNILNQNQNIEPVKTEPVKELKKKPTIVLLISAAVIVVGAGVFTGFKLSRIAKKGTSTSLEKGIVPKEKIVKGQEFGVKDPGKADTAIGVVERGGIDGEGTHKLLREGGPSQNIYMTSSVLDLEQFVGVKIQVWGETNKAQKAGWLMDVIRVKVLD